MKENKPGSPVTPECLAAFVDGELDAAMRRQVQAWLADHPAAAAEIDAQRRLARVWQAAPVPEPAAAQWNVLLGRIDSALPRNRNRSWALSNRRLNQVVWVIAGMAAVALLAFTLPRGQPSREDTSTPDEFEPYVVAAPEDIEIVRMHAADRMSLVVGTPPLEGELEWVVPGDVTVENVTADTDGMMPDVATNDPVLPIIMAPLDAAGRRKP